MNINLRGGMYDVFKARSQGRGPMRELHYGLAAGSLPALALHAWYRAQHLFAQRDSSS